MLTAANAFQKLNQKTRTIKRLENALLKDFRDFSETLFNQNDLKNTKNMHISGQKKKLTTEQQVFLNKQLKFYKKEDRNLMKKNNKEKQLEQERDLAKLTKIKDTEKAHFQGRQLLKEMERKTKMNVDENGKKDKKLINKRLLKFYHLINLQPLKSKKIILFDYNQTKIQKSLMISQQLFRSLTILRKNYIYQHNFYNFCLL